MPRRSKTARFRARANAEAGDTAPARPTAHRPKSSAGSAGGGSGASGGSSRGRASRLQGTAQPRVGRDGKVQISCPNCAAQYRLAPEHMDSKVKCTQCHRVFFPGAASGGSHSAKRQKNVTTPIIAFSSAIVVIVLIGVMIANWGGEPVKQEYVERSRFVAMGNSTPQVKAVLRWAKGIFAKQRYEVENFTAFTNIQEQLGIDPKHKYRHSFGEAQKTLGNKILDALMTGEAAAVFQYCEARSGRIMDKAYLKATEGKIRLSLTEPKKNREALVVIDYVETADGAFKVAGWEVVSAPKRPLTKEEMDRKLGILKPHAKIAKPKTVNKMFGGEMIEVKESALVPLNHLEDTPPELRKQIDTLISNLMDHSDPRAANKAWIELENIGKPAIPRLLNKLYEVKPRGKDDVEALNRVVKTLRTLSGQAFGYNPRELIGENVGGSLQERESALRQWYGWWYYMYGSKRWNELVDSDEEEFMSTAEIRKKREAERQARLKTAREARAKKKRNR